MRLDDITHGFCADETVSLDHQRSDENKLMETYVILARRTRNHEQQSWSRQKTHTACAHSEGRRQRCITKQQCVMEKPRGTRWQPAVKHLADSISKKPICNQHVGEVRNGTSVLTCFIPGVVQHCMLASAGHCYEQPVEKA